MIQRMTPQKWANSLTIILNSAYGNGAERFPVKVGQLAKDFSRQRFPDDPVTLVRGDSLPGFDGALCRAPSRRKGWGIIYNNSVGSQGRINFTLAHEFGHYLLHRRDFPDGIKCSPQDMVRWDGAYNQIERQANIFAATLLMPLDDFRRQIEPRVKPTMDDLSRCADRYGVSLTAATLRWLEYTKRRSILVQSRDGFIRWSRSSSRAYKTGAFFRSANVSPVSIPETSLPMRPDCANGNATTATHDAGVWLPEPCEEISLISDRYDFSISLLHLAGVPHQDDVAEEPDEDAYDSMTNRTLGSSWLK